MYYRHSAFYGQWETEEATTKASEDEIKFDEVHACLSKGEYPVMRYKEAVA